jgi:hypothetical protein
MTLHQVKLKQPNPHNKTELYGYISKLEPEKGSFLLLERDQVGVLGLDGHRIQFTDCEGVYYQTKPGSYRSEEQIQVWLRHARANRLL